MDLSTPTGRMLARMLGAATRHEAQHKAERQRRAGLQKARAGQPQPSHDCAATTTADISDV